MKYIVYLPEEEIDYKYHIFDDKEKAKNFLALQDCSNLEYYLFEQLSEAKISGLEYYDASFILINWASNYGKILCMLEKKQLEEQVASFYADFEPAWWLLVSAPVRIYQTIMT